MIVTDILPNCLAMTACNIEEIHTKLDDLLIQYFTTLKDLQMCKSSLIQQQREACPAIKCILIAAGNV